MGVPELASDRVNCARGGKHTPKSLEGKNEQGDHIKYTVCRKCNLRLSGKH